MALWVSKKVHAIFDLFMSKLGKSELGGQDF